jgi:hypothetical protein
LNVAASSSIAITNTTYWRPLDASLTLSDTTTTGTFPRSAQIKLNFTTSLGPTYASQPISGNNKGLVFSSTTMSSNDLDTSGARVVDVRSLTSHFTNKGYALGNGADASLGGTGNNSIGIAAGGITSTEIGTGSVASNKINSNITTGAASPASGTASSLIVSAGSTQSTVAVSSTNTVTDLYSDFFSVSKSSDLATAPRLLASTTANLVSTTQYSGITRCTGKTTTFSNLRAGFTAVPTAWTDLRLAIHDSTGAVVAYTASLTTATGATSVALLTGAIAFNSAGSSISSITLTAGTTYYLAIHPAFTSGTLTMRGLALSTLFTNAITGAPALSKSGTAYASGAPSALGSSYVAFIPWIEAY